MATVKMYGPAFDKAGAATGKLVNRDVEDIDVHAYKVAGYKEGELPEVKDEKPDPKADKK